MILDEAFNILLSRFTTGIEVKEWCVLKRYVVLELSSGVCGVAYYPHDVTPKIPNFRAKDPIKAARLYRSRVAGRRAIGVAVLNALTWALKPIPLGSATHLIRLMCGKRVAMVGYFRPLLHRFEHAGNLKIIERNEMEGVYPPEKAEEVLGEADVVLITGSCLVYGGLE